MSLFTEAQFSAIKKKINSGNPLNRKDVLYLFSSSEETMWEQIFQIADTIRHENVGDKVHLRGLIEFSNYCIRNCYYCGLRGDNREQIRYRMEPDEIIENAQRVASYGIKTVVLQSGEDPYYTIKKLQHIIRSIKETAEVAITLSIGEKTHAEYTTLKKAGADRYLLRHEAASPELYAKLHPDSQFENRLRCVYDLFDVGFQVGIGALIGAPFQRVEDMVADVMLLQKLQPDMIGTGPFIANAQTPFAHYNSGSLADTLKMTALARIVCPLAHIPATTATETISTDGRQKALNAGANVVMPNFTPQKYKIHYNIYPDKSGIQEDGYTQAARIRTLIEDMGRKISTGYGHSYRHMQQNG